MKSVVTIWMIFACASISGIQPSNSSTLGEIKEWHLNSQHGVITLKLTTKPTGSDGRTVLSFVPDATSTPTVIEEAGLVTQALNEMASLGYDPQKLEMISTWLQSTEYREGVQRAVAESGKWKSCVNRKYCHEAEASADRYLKSVDAFKPFDDALRAHGLERRSVRIDDMGIGQEAGHVSCSGLIVITLGPKE